MIYLGRRGHAFLQDNDTMNLRFANGDTRWFPVSTLYSDPPFVKIPENVPLKQMTMDTIKMGEYYFVTKDLAELKKAWIEAGLGDMDDDVLKFFLEQKVYTITLETHDNTMNVRLENQDTQWFPVSTLYSDEVDLVGVPQHVYKKEASPTTFAEAGGDNLNLERQNDSVRLDVPETILKNALQQYIE